MPVAGYVPVFNQRLSVFIAGLKKAGYKGFNWSATEDGFVLRGTRTDELTKAETAIGIELRPVTLNTSVADCGSNFIGISRIAEGQSVLPLDGMLGSVSIIMQAGMRENGIAVPNTSAEDRNSQTSSSREAPKPTPSAMPENTSKSATASIWQDDQTVSGTCTVTADGRTYMNGSCSGLGHGSYITVTSDADGCTVDLDRSGDAKLYAYKDSCGDLETDVPLAKFHDEGVCWASDTGRLCLTPSS
jgi:hypothetical protein